MSTHQVKSRPELRAWLAAHYATAGSTFIVTFKKHSPHYLEWGELVSELLCWGWIDSVRKAVDDDRTSIRISRRNPNSAWSGINKAKVIEARETGQMTPAGEAVIAIAKANGAWEFLDDIEALILPDYLVKSKGFDQSAWDEYPITIKRSALYWLKSAKTETTRRKRLEDVLDSLQNGQRPTPFR